MKRTRIHPETRKKLSRGVRPFTVRYGGLARTVDLPGWYPAGKSNEGVHVGDDMVAADRALAELKAEAHGLLKPNEVRTIRLRLKLSQRKAGELLGGGPRAFQKYESGEVMVSKPMAQLLRLLAHEPARLRELARGTAEAELEKDPRFLRRIEQARTSIRTGRGVRFEELDRD